MTETIQCEQCGQIVPEATAECNPVPGATLCFCPECAEKPYRRQVL